MSNMNMDDNDLTSKDGSKWPKWVISGKDPRSVRIALIITHNSLEFNIRPEKT